MTGSSRVDGVQQHACMASSGGARCCKHSGVMGKDPCPSRGRRSRLTSGRVCTH